MGCADYAQLYSTSTRAIVSIYFNPQGGIMKFICLFAFTVFQLAAMQHVELPADHTGIAKSIIMQSGRAETKTNMTALTHTLGAIQASPGLPNPEAGRLTKLDSLKVKVNNFLNAPKISGSINAQSAGLIQEAEKLVDEAVDFWAGNTADAAVAQKRQKIAAMITTGVSLTGNATLLALAIYYGLGSKCTSGS